MANDEKENLSKEILKHINDLTFLLSEINLMDLKSFNWIKIVLQYE